MGILYYQTKYYNQITSCHCRPMAVLLSGNICEHVIHFLCSSMPSSGIIWYWPKGSDSLQLGRYH